MVVENSGRERLRYRELREKYENLDERLKRLEVALKAAERYAEILKFRILDLEEKLEPTPIPKDHPSLDLSL